MEEKIWIIGAGPAGLTAAYELLKHGKKDVTILEKDAVMGGISRTTQYHGNRMDIGGHRLFSKVARVNEWWEKMLPMQGAPALDDRIVERKLRWKPGGPDPECVDEVMLLRQRVSRIIFQGKFYDYPVSLNAQTLRNMGAADTIKVGLLYLWAKWHPLLENNLENFYINRFGRKLYEMFFEGYTEKLWGRHPAQIDASWGVQRVKGLSISAVVKNYFHRQKESEKGQGETSLIEEFRYPKFGPGQLWETTAGKIKALGGRILTDACVTGIYRAADGRIHELDYQKDGRTIREAGDIFISSMPLKELVADMDGVPEEIARIAKGLPYRDYMTVGVLVKKLGLRNKTKRKTLGNIVPDCWMYVQERQVKMGRIQIYNNWSPYLVADPEHTVWLGLEYFVQEKDEFWNMEDDTFAAFAIQEMITLGLAADVSDVLDVHVVRVPKAYPAYFDTYGEIGQLRDWLDEIPNLYCVGRNGQHRYNNMDHSMCTAFEAVDLILTGKKDRTRLWGVNTEQKFHEET